MTETRDLKALWRKRDSSRLFKFAIVSGIGWLIDVSLTLSLAGMGVAVFFANWVGALCAVSYVFVVSQYKIFSGQSGFKVHLFTAYLIYQILAISVASALVALVAVAALPVGDWLSANVMALINQTAFDPRVVATAIAKVAVTPLTLYSNFIFMGWLLERRISWW